MAQTPVVDLKIMQILNAMSDVEITVGLHEEDGGQIVPGSDTVLAQIAAWNEYGTSRIPARPAYRQFAASEAVTQGIAEFTTLTKTATDEGAIEAALSRLGQHLAQGLWTHVDNFTVPPNAEATVRAKGRNDPLVDSGRTRDSISWVLSKRRNRIKKGRARG